MIGNDFESLILEKLAEGSLNLEDKMFLLDLLKQRKDFRRYNKQDYFKAYEFQKKFYSAGNTHRFRFLCAANR